MDVDNETLMTLLVEQEVYWAKNDPKEWPSLFTNLIGPWEKNLSSASKLYKSLNDKELRIRLAINEWERDAWSVYEGLTGNSLIPMGKSIDPRLWAQKEISNVELFLKEGKNQLMTPRNFFRSEGIPEMYDQLINGEWKNFIDIDEVDRFNKAHSIYLENNGIDPADSICLANANFNVLFGTPKENDFLNRSYFIAKDVQSLLWYKEFLKEVKRNGVDFYAHHDDDEVQKNNLEEKYSDIKSDEFLSIVIDPIDLAREEFIVFTKSVLNQYPNALTADLRTNCFEDMRNLNSRDALIINELLIKAGAKKSKVSGHAKFFEWKIKYPKAQWERVFKKINK